MKFKKNEKIALYFKDCSSRWLKEVGHHIKIENRKKLSNDYRMGLERCINKMWQINVKLANVYESEDYQPILNDMSDFARNTSIASFKNLLDNTMILIENEFELNVTDSDDDGYDTEPCGGNTL